MNAFVAAAPRAGSENERLLHSLDLYLARQARSNGTRRKYGEALAGYGHWLDQRDPGSVGADEIDPTSNSGASASSSATVARPRARVTAHRSMRCAPSTPTSTASPSSPTHTASRYPTRCAKSCRPKANQPATTGSAQPKTKHSSTATAHSKNASSSHCCAGAACASAKPSASPAPTSTSLPDTRRSPSATATPQPADARSRSSPN